MFHEEGNRSNSFVRPEQYTQCVFAAFHHTGLLFFNGFYPVDNWQIFKLGV